MKLLKNNENISIYWSSRKINKSPLKTLISVRVFLFLLIIQYISIMLSFSHSYSVILTHSSFVINYTSLYLNVKEYKQKKKLAQSGHSNISFLEKSQILRYLSPVDKINFQVPPTGFTRKNILYLRK